MPITVDIDANSPARYKSAPLGASELDKLKQEIATFLQGEIDKKRIVLQPGAQTTPFTIPDYKPTDDTNTAHAVDCTLTDYTADGKAKVTVEALAVPQVPQVAPSELNVLSGVEEFLNEPTPSNHVGIAITLESNGKTSVLTVPDVGAVKDGKSAVYITKPISLQLSKLKKFIEKKGVALPSAIEGLLDNTELSCDAFYFTGGTGPLLMVFQIKFTNGLIASLTGDKDIGELFDVKGAAVRVFRCSKEQFGVLQNYAAELRGEKPATPIEAPPPPA
jgi:hypothetical protein